MREHDVSLSTSANRWCRNLAALGAIATLLNLAFAAFTQQLISTTLKDSSFTDFSQPFPRTLTYQGKDAFFGSRVDYATRSTIIAAGLQGDNALPFQLSCQTGNCTYMSNIPTLAMCGGCTDVTHHLNNSRGCDWTIPDCQGTGQCRVKGSVCPYSLPNGASLRFQPGMGPERDRGLWAVWNATNINYAVYDALVYNDAWHVYTMKFSTIGLDPSKAVPFLQSVASFPQAGGTLPAVSAQECALWWCKFSRNKHDRTLTPKR